MTNGPRAGALDFLLKWYALPQEQRQPVPPFQTLMAEAEKLAEFIELDATPDTKIVIMRWGQVTDETTGKPVIPLPPVGDVMQLTDTQQVTFTVAAQDSKGNAVAGDAFTASVDNTAIVTVTGPDATGTFTVAAAEPGTGAILTVTDGTLTVTSSFDVVAGSAATIELTFGTPTDEPAPAPVPDPVPTPDPAPTA